MCFPLRPCSLLNDHCYLPLSQITPHTQLTTHTVPMETGESEVWRSSVGGGDCKISSSSPTAGATEVRGSPVVKSEPMEIAADPRRPNIVDHRRCVLCNLTGDAPCDVSSGLRVNVSSGLRVNVSSGLRINVSSGLRVNVSCGLRVNVSSGLRINVSSGLRVNVSCGLRVNVSSGLSQ